MRRAGYSLQTREMGSRVDPGAVAPAGLDGRRIVGVPHDAEGFIATRRQGRIEKLDDVYACGDVTRFPIKQGGIAAQQADLVAEQIALRAGATSPVRSHEPVLHALLLTGASRSLCKPSRPRLSLQGLDRAALLAARQDRRPLPGAVPRRPRPRRHPGSGPAQASLGHDRDRRALTDMDGRTVPPLDRPAA